MNAKSGFTMIEAMVSLAVAGMALTAIFSMQFQLVHAQKLHEQALETSTVRHAALTMIRDVNFDVTPEGDVDLPPNLSLHWTTTPLYDPKMSAGFPGGNGNYMMTIYTVTMEVDGADGNPVDTFNVERTGWTSTAQANVGLTGVAAAPTPPTIPTPGG